MPASPKTRTKSGTVTRLLSREKGATLAEIAKATDWKPHSCRAFLTGVRKISHLLKEERSDGTNSYRIAQERAPEVSGE